jgi:hypothetical protein
MGSHARVGVTPGLTARVTEVHVRSPFGSRYGHGARLGKAPGTPGQTSAPAPPLVNPIAFALGTPMSVAGEYGGVVRQRLGPLTRMEGVIGHLAQTLLSNSVARTSDPQCASPYLPLIVRVEAAFGIETWKRLHAVNFRCTPRRRPCIDLKAPARCAVDPTSPCRTTLRRCSRRCADAPPASGSRRKGALEGRATHTMNDGGSG